MKLDKLERVNRTHAAQGIRLQHWMQDGVHSHRVNDKSDERHDGKLGQWDILGLGELRVGHSGHHVERGDDSGPDRGASPLDHLHHIPGKQLLL